MEKRYPDLVVFDLDMCLWSPEMYVLNAVPTLKDAIIGRLNDAGDEGVIGIRTDRGDTVKLFPGALYVLQQIYAGKYPNIKIAAASSADNALAVRCAHACLNILEVIPGVSARKVFALGWPEGFEGNLQIGREAPLSEHKERTHFPFLKQYCGIEYNQMLFFDDCNWSDNVGDVMRGCTGVVGIRTPKGLQKDEWQYGMDLFSKLHS